MPLDCRTIGQEQYFINLALRGFFISLIGLIGPIGLIGLIGYNLRMSYKDLKSFQQATIIYDFTVEFCDKFLDRKSRTVDQMEQAARSGKQNIAEGSSERSQKTALHLLGIARASFQELLEDYEDFLRQCGFRQWGKDDREAVEIRQIVYKSNWSYGSYRTYLADSAIAANTAICLIHQVNFLLDRQIMAAERQFIKEGDYNEKLSQQRNEVRKRELVNRFWRKFN